MDLTRTQSAHVAAAAELAIKRYTSAVCVCVVINEKTCWWVSGCLRILFHHLTCCHNKWFLITGIYVSKTHPAYWYSNHKMIKKTSLFSHHGDLININLKYKRCLFDLKSTPWYSKCIRW